MPSPFPGMDPYLESPTHWRGFHELLIAAMTATLNATLPEGFVANIDERLYVLYEQRSIYPDVLLLRTAPTVNRPIDPSSVAVLERPAIVSIDEEDEALEVTLLADEQRESYVEIIQLAHGTTEERVVALIELLSPANKTTGTGREEYRRKQRWVLESSIHLLEIDLLRGGEHTVALPEASLPAGRANACLICLHPADAGSFYRFWPRTLRERLPRIRLPLSSADQAVTLDIQTAFDRAYDAGPYRSRVDYRPAPDPPLSADDAALTDRLLRDQGRRL